MCLSDRGWWNKHIVDVIVALIHRMLYVPFLFNQFLSENNEH